MIIERIHQAGNETPDSHIFTLSCPCGDFVSIGFDQGKEGEWVIKAVNQFTAHANLKHPTAAATAK
jgi:hypothetical protein